MTGVGVMELCRLHLSGSPLCVLPLHLVVSLLLQSSNGIGAACREQVFGVIWWSLLLQSRNGIGAACREQVFGVIWWSLSLQSRMAYLQSPATKRLIWEPQLPQSSNRVSIAPAGRTSSRRLTSWWA